MGFTSTASGLIFVFGGKSTDLTPQYQYVPLNDVNYSFNSDLFEFNPSSLEWRKRNTSSERGKRPSDRAGLGLASMGDELYLFGGNGADAGKSRCAVPLLILKERVFCKVQER